MTAQNISHYHIIKKLGAGGMGEVYLAEDTTLSRRVALKLLPPEHTQDQERLRRFKQEAKAWWVLHMMALFAFGFYNFRYLMTAATETAD